MPKASDPTSSYAARKKGGRRMLSLWLPAELYKRLRIEAVETEQTIQASVQRILERHLGRAK